MKEMGRHDLSRLSDSRLLYMRRIPRFTYIFTIVVAMVLIGVTVWAGVTVKAEEIEGHGIVVTEGSMNIIPLAGGVVSKILFVEGQTVNEGDVLFTLDSSTLEDERSSYASALAYYTERSGFAQTAIDSLNGDPVSNPFTNTGNESEFYSSYQYFLIQYNAAMGEEAKDSLRLQMITSMYSEKNTCIGQISSLESTVNNYEKEMDKCSVRAMCTGIVHYDDGLKEGVVLQSGNPMGSISSDDREKYIEQYVPSALRAKMDVGQECRFIIDGLLQSEYGSVIGRIESISSDVSLTDSGAFFKVKVKYDQDHMTDSKGNRVNIINGMTVKTWCIYEKSTYLKHFLDKLGISG